MRPARAPTALLLACSSLSAACGGCAAAKPPPPQFVRAQPLPDPPLAASSSAPPLVQAPPTAAPVATMAGQLKPLPPPHVIPPVPTGKHGAVAPQQVVLDANRRASQAPDASSYFNAIVQYTYEPGTLYQVFAAPMRITDITLQAGEKIVGQPASGDTVRWVLAEGKSLLDGAEQWHVYVKPTRPGLETNLAINTDRHAYMLELRSYDETYMAVVTWRFPQDEMAKWQTEALAWTTQQKDAAPVVSVQALHFNYAVQAVSGKPTWTPTQVFDDGVHTFVRFPPAMLVREAPALFVLRSGETQLVNYRMKNDLYVVDRLFDAAELRVGGKNDEEVVRITREARR